MIFRFIIALLLTLPSYSEATEPVLPQLWPIIEKGKLTEVNSSQKEFDLTSLKDKILVVQFWASWCPNCKIEMAELAKFQQSFPQEKYKILAISEDENFKDALTASKKIDKSLTLLFDKERILFKTLPKHKLPFTLVFLPQDRRLVCLFNGYNPRRFERMKSCIQNLVNKTSPSPSPSSSPTQKNDPAAKQKQPD